ncbi:hypothetical protein B5M42_010715 [Paenibacillus athensensis]|nr:hypothetical protein [Paenibacillus athensensis]MCD1259307.1 hypothetical protein [Paenibacillus athensensis]
MKLAFVNEAPTEEQLSGFIQAYAKECESCGLDEGMVQAAATAGYVVSVYDNDLLIALGGGTGETALHVLPSYRYREIDVTLGKLLTLGN